VVLALESILASLSIFARLRPDEIGRIARRFETHALARGETKSFAATMADTRLVVVVTGRVALAVSTRAGTLRSVLEPGDRYGDVPLLTEHVLPMTFTAETACEIATIDRAGFDALMAEFAAIALPLSTELASELAARNDLLRQLLELDAERLPAEQMTAALDERRASIARRGARVTRQSRRALFRRLVVQEGAEPPFWMLFGFLVALGGARLVVALILKYGLEKHLFALVQGADPNPMHVHHFNYGLLLIGAAGLAALFPFGRRALRILAFTFGAGCGLVFDEFALFWNLNPEYAQGLSLIASAIFACALLQMLLFRRYWAALARRMWFAARGAR
jgi:CRP-like cAMP-binding protein